MWKRAQRTEDLGIQDGLVIRKSGDGLEVNYLNLLSLATRDEIIVTKRPLNATSDSRRLLVRVKASGVMLFRGRLPSLRVPSGSPPADSVI